MKSINTHANFVNFNLATNKGLKYFISLRAAKQIFDPVMCVSSTQCLVASLHFLGAEFRLGGWSREDVHDDLLGSHP
jgi:hypothetical protein